MATPISIVIPTLNAETYLPQLLTSFESQSTGPPEEVILVDSASDDRTVSVAESFSFVQIVSIKREAFTHGYARNVGVRKSSGEIVVFVSQDALPYDDQWLAHLTAPFEDPTVGGVYSRQIPYKEANPIETTFLNYWFPPTPRHMEAPENATDKGAIRFLDVFFSNVSSAARRDVALTHPFQEQIIMSEDQQFARDLVYAGLSIVYSPDSKIWHSHTYTLKQIFQRYFDSAYSLTSIFGHTMKESLQAGKGYLPHEFRTIFTRYPAWIPYYMMYFVTKGSAVFAGHHAKHMPRRIARLCSMHKRYWDNPWQHHHSPSH